MRWTTVLSGAKRAPPVQPGQKRTRVGHISAIKPDPFVRLPPSAKVYALGTAANPTDDAALLRFPEQGWTVNDGGSEGWAIVGDSEGRKLAVDTLLGRYKITPNSPPPGPLPVHALPQPHRAIETQTWSPVRYLAFAKPSTTGEFTDYTARYGSLQEDDKLTLRQKLETSFGSSEMARKNVFAGLNAMQLKHMVDMPAISLSSGQTRRERIARALMTKPALLILEDPMAGLDAVSRSLVDSILGELNVAEHETRVVRVLKDRGEDTLSEWDTNVLEVVKGEVWIGTAEEWRQRRKARGQEKDSVPEGKNTGKGALQQPIVAMREVSVSYAEGERQVLDEIDWEIKPGDKWHLQGANGSGKTTLLSVLLGHHPQSFSLPAASLTLFSQPRRLIATQVLRALIGHSSPEVFAAFPRNMGLTALEAVGTGYEGVFSRRPLSETQQQRVLYLLGHFRDYLGRTKNGKPTDATVDDISKRVFAHFTAPQQALLVFLRAIVSRPPLLVLDEPTQGVDEDVWADCVKLLEKEWEEMSKDGQEQAVVVVSHYDDEMPWKNGRVLRLDNGRAEVVA